VKRHVPLRRYTRLRQRNSARLARLRAKQFGAQADLCRGLPCYVCRAPAPSDPAHVRTRGAHGQDRANVVPLCREHHLQQHAYGIASFEARMSARYGWPVDLAAEARRLERQAYPDQPTNPEDPT